MPVPMGAREIRQDMIGLLTQSCHMKPSLAVEFARGLAEWIFKPEEPADRSLRWWACKCALVAANSAGVQVGHTIGSAQAILIFVAEEVEETEVDYSLDLDKVS